MGYWADGSLEEAYTAFSKGMDDVKKIDSVLFQIASIIGSAEIKAAQGFLNDTISLYNQSINSAKEIGPEILWVTANHHLGLCMIYIEQDETEKAVSHLEESISFLSKAGSLGDWAYRSCLIKARLKDISKDYTGALSSL